MVPTWISIFSKSVQEIITFHYCFLKSCKSIKYAVGDADKNGVVNYEDKLRVLELCETIIGNRGGIGLYPKTQAVHIDTRGQYARWNSY
jgi:uncharacterized protein YcbK (DUF882 family)